MRIGIDARMYSSKFTGIGRYTYELINHLVTFNNKDTYYIFLRQNEYDNFSISASNVFPILAEIKHYSLAEQFYFPRLLKKFKLDVMHFTHFNAPLFFKGPKIIVTIHDLTLSFFPGNKMTSWPFRLAYHLILKSIVKKSLKIIAVSNNTKQDIINHLNISEHKIDDIYEGVNSEFKKIDSVQESQLRTSYSIKKPYLLYTGVWREHKNVIGLLKAFSILRQKYKIDCDLVITGSKNNRYPEVLDIINNLKLVKHVKLVGLVPENDLIALYNFAKVYVFPSFYEGFGLPPLEAMACGTVVSASNASCIPEICGDHVFYFDPSDVNDMANVINKSYYCDDIRVDIIKTGLNYVKQFSWEKMAQQTLNLYQNL